MRRLVLFAAALAFAVPAPAFGQVSSIYSAAVPPPAEDLDRLRLKTVWAVNLPIDNRIDRLTNVQPVDQGQIFAQTMSGTVLALDAHSGQRQWAFRFPSGHRTNLPATVNSRFVFIAHLSTLYCFNRFSGVLEFSFEPKIRLDLPQMMITSGPVCDENNVYVVLSNNEVLAYRLPGSVSIPEKEAARTAQQFGARGAKATNPADEIGKRYPGGSTTTVREEPVVRSRGMNTLPVDVNTHQVSPSISVLPSVAKPYEFKDRNGLSILRTESLTPLNNLRQPYQIKDADGRYIVKTPSTAVIPASMARVFELNDIRPKGLEPTKLWRFEATNKISFKPVIAGARLWMSFETPRALAIDRLDLSKKDREIQADGTLSAPVSAGIAVDGNMGYFALADGSVIAVDLLFGGTTSKGAVKQMWRANFGGPMDRKPLINQSSVFIGGMSFGVGQVNRKTGDLLMRTAADDDFLLAVNDESAFVRSSQGKLRVYDLASPVDPSTKRMAAIGEVDLSHFRIPIANPTTDRVFLASDNGLLICLRDSSPKYATAKVLLPPPAPAAAAPKEKEGEAGAKEGDPAAPKEGDAAPKQDAPKKDEPKK